MAGTEADALIASYDRVLKTVLECYDSFSIQDMCRQLIPLSSHHLCFLSLYQRCVDCGPVSPRTQIRRIFLRSWTDADPVL